MGCISSKLIIARSISFHEERNQRSKRIANSIPLLEDLIKASNKLHSRSLSSNTTSKLAVEPEIPEDIVYSLTQENLPGFEDKDELRYKGDIGNRSFHTVEEYDDMVNRIWLTKSQIVQQSEFNNEDGDDDDGGGSEIKMDLQEKDSTTKNEEVVPSHETRMLESVSQGVRTIEKGNKRKAIAKRLESLSIPSNVECPAIGSLREWLTADGIYSPGSYITPKFGSYSSMNIRNENESSEDSIFPELISAFEECMQKLEAEEENILKQIIENVEEEIDEGMQT